MSEFKKIPITGPAFSLMISVPAAPGTYVTYALFQLSGYIRDNNISPLSQNPKGFISRARTCVGQKEAYVTYVGGDGRRAIMVQTRANNRQKQGYFRNKPCDLLGFLHLKARKTGNRIFAKSY